MTARTWTNLWCPWCGITTYSLRAQRSNVRYLFMCSDCILTAPLPPMKSYDLHLMVMGPVPKRPS